MVDRIDFIKGLDHKSWDVRLKSGTPGYHPVSYQFYDRKPMRSPSDDS